MADSAATGGKLWRTVACDESLAGRLAGGHGLSPPVARLLASRGIEPGDAADRFLKPRLSDLGDPSELPGMEAAVARVVRAIRAGERIVVFGDYDVDGISSTALLMRVFTRLGAKVAPFLPSRMDEGYGLSLDALHRCIEERAPSLIVTVDCGTGSVDSVEAAGARGIDVVITDHHTPPASIAPAVAVVNPKLANDPAWHVLAGVGVAFKLCHGVVRELRRGGAASDADLREYLDLVALGTIADIVPLTGENRILARHGLERLSRTGNPGLLALRQVAGCEGPADAYEVGFRLGPRLNAAGRLGDALQSLELLLSADAARIAELARDLDAANRERQDIEATMLREAVIDVETRHGDATPHSIVVAREGWHPGVVGIVASRLVQRYHRPTAVIALDGASGRGSCRSIEGFDVVGGLAACADLLVKHGGHAMAAGLEIETERIDVFRERFEAAAVAKLAGTDLRPVQRIDAWMSLADVDDGLAARLDDLKPFGMGNPTPVWAAAGVVVVGEPRVVGRGSLKFQVASGGVQREVIAFGMAEREFPKGPIDLAFHVKKDSFRGVERVVLQAQDFRPARPDSVREP